MNVLRLHGLKDLRLHREPLPTPGAGEVLLRMTSVGVCGSDLHWFSELGIGDAGLTHPLVLGHEFAGVVESPGSALHGARVAAEPAISCQRCDFCREGNAHFCTALRFAGHSQQDGALQEFLAWPERALFRLPDTLSDEDGALLEPLGVALHALNLGKVRPGMPVGVFGAGPIGLLLIQLVRLAGASPIYATDRLDHRLEAAKEAGASMVFLAGYGEESAAILSETHGQGVPVAFEAAGEDAAVEAAITAARAGGRVVLVGIPSEDSTTFTASTARRKGLTLLLSRRMKFTYPRAIQLVERGLVNLGSLVTHRFSLDQGKQAFEVASRREGLKVMVSF